MFGGHELKRMMEEDQIKLITDIKISQILMQSCDQAAPSCAQPPAHFQRSVASIQHGNLGVAGGCASN
jgi:hypothetical protein